MMETEVLPINPAVPEPAVLQRAARILQAGGLVVFPTETVYGLGADGLSEAAVQRIFAAKGRPADNPLILHVADRAMVDRIAAAVPANAERLMEIFWPGPLTVVLPRQPQVPDAVTAGLATVAVRCPASLVARELIRVADRPIAAPSANSSGKPSPTSAAAALEDVDGRVELVLDGGDCPIGLESTVVDCTAPVPILLRPGAVTLEMLQEVLGEIEVDPHLAAAAEAPRSPGMKYAHYAPRAPLRLYEGTADAVAARLAADAAVLLRDGKRVGVLVSAELAARMPRGVQVENYGSRQDLPTIGVRLYQCLRNFDHLPVDEILAEGVTEQGLGLALMNRLRKASGYRIIYC